MPELHIFDYLWRSPLPPATDQNTASAGRSPGGWQYYTDPTVPREQLSWASVLGGRAVDNEGNFTGETWVNPDFRPTPQAAGMEFASPFELIFWRTLEGYANIEQFIAGLRNAELLTIGAPDNSSPYVLHDDGEGKRDLRVYTSAKFLPRDANPWLRQTITGARILEEICAQEDTVIHFNPDGGPSVGLSGENLSAWWAEWTRVDAELKAEGRNQ